MIDQEYITAKEIADKLRINVRTVNRWFKAGKLHPALHLIVGNGGWRIKKTDFDKFLEDLTNGKL